MVPGIADSTARVSPVAVTPGPTQRSVVPEAMALMSAWVAVAASMSPRAVFRDPVVAPSAVRVWASRPLATAGGVTATVKYSAVASGAPERSMPPMA